MILNKSLTIGVEIIRKDMLRKRMRQRGRVNVIALHLFYVWYVNVY